MSKRKNWTEYPPEQTSYGQHKYGFGIHLITGVEEGYWDDPECSLPHEKEKYQEYLKRNGWKE